MRFMVSGNALAEFAADEDLDGFQKLFAETCKNDEELRNLMFWHTQRAFKEAIKYKSLLIIEHLIEDLDLDLRHECFGELLHKFLFTCSMAERYKDEDMKEINR